MNFAGFHCFSFAHYFHTNQSQKQCLVKLYLLLLALYSYHAYNQFTLNKQVLLAPLLLLLTFRETHHFTGGPGL